MTVICPNCGKQEIDLGNKSPVRIDKRCPKCGAVRSLGPDWHIEYGGHAE